MIQIETIKTLDETTLSALTDMLCRVVMQGASIGFFAPLSEQDADKYWRKAYVEYTRAERVIFIAKDTEGHIVGSAQYSGASSANGRHRAEVQKVLVHPLRQREGIGTQLMTALATHALENGRSLLVLDTKLGEVSELLYKRCGYQRVGEIPGYTRTPHGKAQTTVIYFKHLSAER